MLSRVRLPRTAWRPGLLARADDSGSLVSGFAVVVAPFSILRAASAQPPRAAPESRSVELSRRVHGYGRARLQRSDRWSPLPRRKRTPAAHGSNRRASSAWWRNAQRDWARTLWPPTTPQLGPRRTCQLRAGVILRHLDAYRALHVPRRGPRGLRRHPRLTTRNLFTCCSAWLLLLWRDNSPMQGLCDGSRATISRCQRRRVCTGDELRRDPPARSAEKPTPSGGIRVFVLHMKGARTGLPTPAVPAAIEYFTPAARRPVRRCERSHRQRYDNSCATDQARTHDRAATELARFERRSSTCRPR